MRWKRAFVIGALLTIALAASFGWYYERYLWPQRIQKELLGRVVVDKSELVHREGFSHYGEGGFKWRYSVRRPTAALTALCGGRSIPTCRISKVREISEGVTVSFELQGGVVTIEEIWD